MSQSLKEELHWALIDCLDGSPASNRLFQKMRTVARGILLRHGLGKAQVHIGPGPGGVEVVVLLPPGPARATRIVLNVGAGPF